ncbi:hypothetical protein AVDCRST_MAG92-953 [uncultured Coleofasciculus sp.]|uniref:Uncharacterized protein n=1 Tax=uncultured Coleofasciculus sp. TaxID=1267456 RepID=A0A6J4HN70_9CYAN|nr:hypothetical protein AVDCRST_MAG92-953 [uncultured Coleofasciculus sp.]
MSRETSATAHIGNFSLTPTRHQCESSNIRLEAIGNHKLLGQVPNFCLGNSKRKRTKIKISALTATYATKLRLLYININDLTEVWLTSQACSNPKRVG